MNDIKPGDLVMVIKPTPCCGSAHRIGSVYVVSEGRVKKFGRCIACGKLNPQTDADTVLLGQNVSYWRSRVKKIDPPAEGDSLPTRRDLEVEA